jgi:hypothetical protein
MISTKQKIHSEDFENQFELVITHNLNDYISSATIFSTDNPNVKVESIINDNANQCTITLSELCSGKIYVMSDWLSYVRNDGTEFELSVNSEGNLIATEII